MRSRSVRSISARAALALLVMAGAAACGDDDDDSGAAAATTAAPADSPTTTSEPPQEVTDVSVCFIPWAGDVTTFVAKEEGFFADQGLNVDFVNVNASPQAVQLTLAGEIIGCMYDVSTVFLAADNGQQLRAIGAIANTNFLQAYSRADDDSLDPAVPFEERIQALQGKTVGVSVLQNFAQLAVTAALEDVGLSGDDVTFVATGDRSASIQALTTGNVDVYIGAIPTESVVDEAGGQLYIDFGTEAPASFRTAGAVFVVAADWLEDNRDIAERYMAAHAEAIEWLKDPANADAASTLIASNLLNDDVDAARDVLDQLTLRYDELTAPDLAVSEDSFDNTRALLASSGQISDDVPGYDVLVDNVLAG